LENDFKLNIEVNHATLAGHTFEHELQCAVDAGMLGAIDANRGDVQNGWDTDQFPNNINELTEAMLVIVEAGGFAGGGINFDAKIRRNSTDSADLFHAHIGIYQILLFIFYLVPFVQCHHQRAAFFFNMVGNGEILLFKRKL